MGIEFTGKATYGGEGATTYRRALELGESEREAHRLARIAEEEPPLGWDDAAKTPATR